MSKQVVPRRVANYTPGLFSISNDLCDHFASQRDANGWMNDIFDAMGKWSLKGVSYVVFDEQIDVFSGEDMPELPPLSKQVKNMRFSDYDK